MRIHAFVLALLCLTSLRADADATDLVVAMLWDEKAVLFLGFDDFAWRGRITAGASPSYLRETPDGRQLYVVSTGERGAAAGSISLMDLETMKEVRRVSLAGIGRPESMDLVGSRLFVSSYEEIAEIDPATGAAKWKKPLPELTVASCVLPDQRTALLQYTYGVGVMDLESGKARTILDENEAADHVGQMLLAPDAREVWIVRAKELIVLELPTGRQRMRKTLKFRSCGQPICGMPVLSFLDDRTLLFYGNGEIGLIDRARAEVTRRAEFSGYPLVSSDGKRVRLIGGLARPVVRELDLDSFTPGAETVLEGLAARVAFSPSGAGVIRGPVTIRAAESRTVEHATRFFDGGDFEAAAKLLGYELETNPGDAEALLLLGKVNLLTGKERPGSSTIEKALAIDRSLAARASAAYLEVAQRIVTEDRESQYASLATLVYNGARHDRSAQAAFASVSLLAARKLLGGGFAYQALQLASGASSYDPSVAQEADSIRMSAVRSYIDDGQSVLASQWLLGTARLSDRETAARFLLEIALLQPQGAGSLRDPLIASARQQLPLQPSDERLFWDLYVAHYADPQAGAKRFLELYPGNGPLRREAERIAGWTCASVDAAGAFPLVPLEKLTVVTRSEVIVDDGCVDCAAREAPMLVDAVVDECGRVRQASYTWTPGHPDRMSVEGAAMGWRFEPYPRGAPRPFRTEIATKVVHHPLLDTSKRYFLTGKSTRASVERTTPFYVTDATGAMLLISTDARATLPEALEKPGAVHPDGLCYRSVRFRAAIDRAGRVLHADFESGSFEGAQADGYDGTEMETRAFRRWTFRPSMLDGRAVDSVA